MGAGYYANRRIDKGGFMKLIIALSLIQLFTVAYSSHDTWQAACEEEGGQIVDLCVENGGVNMDFKGYRACVQK
jgi:hypothetical protein